MRSQRGAKRATWQRKMIAKWKHVTTCEWGGCYEYTEENAHRLKKTKITTEEEYADGRAKLCRMHHQSLDEATEDNPHETMFLKIDTIMRANGRVIVTLDSERMMAVIERLGLTRE